MLRVIAQMLKALAVLAEDYIWFPEPYSGLQPTNFNSKGSDALYWFLWTHAYGEHTFSWEKHTENKNKSVIIN